jgi:hypothetical protein
MNTLNTAKQNVQSKCDVNESYLKIVLSVRVLVRVSGEKKLS